MNNSTESIYPLSPMQQGMLLHSIHEQSGPYVQQLVCELPAPVFADRLKQAWQSVIQQHAPLRTAFRWRDVPEPEQRVFPDVSLPWRYEDWEHTPEADRLPHWNDYLAADRQRGFDLTTAPLLRVALIRFTPASYRMLWTFHHALLDGRSHFLVLREVFDRYDGETNFADPREYSEYIEWLRSQDLAKAENYWREKLKGFTDPLTLPELVFEAKAESFHSRHGVAEKIVTPALTDRLRECAREHDVTLNTIVQAAWAVLLARYTEQKDVVFGVTRACRRWTEDAPDERVGLFINTLPLRVTVNSSATLSEWLRALRQQNLELRGFEHTPLMKIQEWSEVSRGTPLFETVLVFENYQMPRRFRRLGGRWTTRNITLHEQNNYPLVLGAYADDDLLLKIEFDRNRFDSSSIERMLAQLETLLQAISTNPHHLERVFVLPAGERQLLASWNDTTAPFDSKKCLHELFEQQVTRSPQSVAVICEEETLTYQQLNDRADQLAARLRSEGVLPETLVGICLERSLAMVIALLATLKAGAAYVPLDPSYPAARLSFMIADARLKLVLAQRSTADRVEKQVRTVCLDSEWSPIPDSQTTTTQVAPENGAYVIHTSGSTGQPKGVLVPHQAIVNHMQWMAESFPLVETDRLLQKTPISFDASVWEFYAPLICGAQLVMAQPYGHVDAAYLIKAIKELRITTLQLVPSLLRALLRQERLSECVSLKRVFCGGEAIPPELIDEFRLQCNAELINLYGPTEATIDATYWLAGTVQRFTRVPIGRPISNIRAYVLDDFGLPVPIGVSGELFLGGSGLARGYLHAASLTAENFVPDPFSTNGARLYKTGDRVRFLPDGNLEFMGRRDEQVKIRGYRIEVGEVESTLRLHPYITDAVVTAKPDRFGEYGLIAYVTSNGQSATANDLQTFLAERLPSHMVPSMFVALPELPLTANGKIDRHRLPDPAELQSVKTATAAPQTSEEQILAAIWSEVLNLEQVSRDDNFFFLGGHSLLVTQVMARLREQIGVELPVRTLFESPTLAGLARVVAQVSSHVQSASESSINRVPREPYRPENSSGE